MNLTFTNSSIIAIYEMLSPASYSSSASSPACRLYSKASVVPKTPAEAAEHGEQPACIQSLLSLYSPSPLILQRLSFCCFPYDLHEVVIKPNASLEAKTQGRRPLIKAHSAAPQSRQAALRGLWPLRLHRYIPMFFGWPDLPFAAHDFKSLNQARPCFTRNDDCIYIAPGCRTVRI